MQMISNCSAPICLNLWLECQGVVTDKVAGSVEWSAMSVNYFSTFVLNINGFSDKDLTGFLASITCQVYTLKQAWALMVGAATGRGSGPYARPSTKPRRQLG
jgi:hypothetical protein